MSSWLEYYLQQQQQQQAGSPSNATTRPHLNGVSQSPRPPAVNQRQQQVMVPSPLIGASSTSVATQHPSSRRPVAHTSRTIGVPKRRQLMLQLEQLNSEHTTRTQGQTFVPPAPPPSNFHVGGGSERRTGRGAVAPQLPSGNTKRQQQEQHLGNDDEAQQDFREHELLTAFRARREFYDEACRTAQHIMGQLSDAAAFVPDEERLKTKPSVFARYPTYTVKPKGREVKVLVDAMDSGGQRTVLEDPFCLDDVDADEQRELGELTKLKEVNKTRLAKNALVKRAKEKHASNADSMNENDEDALLVDEDAVENEYEDVDDEEVSTSPLNDSERAERWGGGPTEVSIEGVGRTTVSCSEQPDGTILFHAHPSEIARKRRIIRKLWMGNVIHLRDLYTSKAGGFYSIGDASADGGQTTGGGARVMPAMDFIHGGEGEENALIDVTVQDDTHDVDEHGDGGGGGSSSPPIVSTPATTAPSTEEDETRGAIPSEESRVGNNTSQQSGGSGGDGEQPLHQQQGHAAQPSRRGYDERAIPPVPTFNSRSLAWIAESICHDMDNITTSTENILRITMNVHARRNGSVDAELKKCNYLSRKALLWCQGAQSHAATYLKGESCVVTGVKMELDVTKRSLIHQHEELSSLQKMVDDSAADVEDMRADVEECRRRLRILDFVNDPTTELHDPRIRDVAISREATLRLRQLIHSAHSEFVSNRVGGAPAAAAAAVPAGGSTRRRTLVTSPQAAPQTAQSQAALGRALDNLLDVLAQRGDFTRRDIGNVVSGFSAAKTLGIKRRGRSPPQAEIAS